MGKTVFIKINFGYYLMAADDALISLGLAKKGIDLDYLEEGVVTF